MKRKEKPKYIFGYLFEPCIENVTIFKLLFSLFDDFKKSLNLGPKESFSKKFTTVTKKNLHIK
jgi:hypothetical protein